MKANKKAMGIGEIYGAVLTFVLVGVVLGIGIYILQKTAASSGLSSDAVAAINSTSTNLGTFGTTWIPILLIVLGAGITISLLVSSFMGKGR